MTARPARPSESGREDLLIWVERVATYFASGRMTPIAGRVLGWLMICDPAEQTAEQIADAIGASRASLTTNLQLLAGLGFVVRQTRPGSRTAYYRTDGAAWEKVVRRQIASLVGLGDITGDGMKLVGHGRRADRLREAQTAIDWLSAVFANAPPYPAVPAPSVARPAGRRRGKPGTIG